MGFRLVDVSFNVSYHCDKCEQLFLTFRFDLLDDNLSKIVSVLEGKHLLQKLTPN